jgi:hypothetical protein
MLEKLSEVCDLEFNYNCNCPVCGSAEGEPIYMQKTVHVITLCTVPGCNWNHASKRYEVDGQVCSACAGVGELALTKVIGVEIGANPCKECMELDRITSPEEIDGFLKPLPEEIYAPKTLQQV